MAHDGPSLDEARLQLVDLFDKGRMEHNRNGRGRRCPVCGRGRLRPRSISEVFEYGDEGDSVLVRTQDVPIEDCLSCGESLSGPAAARIRHDAIGRAYGFLPPQDIRALRERLGRSPEEFAKLLGVGVSRLAQWEDGTLWQDRTADLLLRLLRHRTENLADLEALIATPATSGSEEEEPATSSRRQRRRVILPGKGDDGL